MFDPRNEAIQKRAISTLIPQDTNRFDPQNEATKELHILDGQHTAAQILWTHIHT